MNNQTLKEVSTAKGNSYPRKTASDYNTDRWTPVALKLALEKNENKD